VLKKNGLQINSNHNYLTKIGIKPHGISKIRGNNGDNTEGNFIKSENKTKSKNITTITNNTAVKKNHRPAKSGKKCLFKKLHHQKTAEDQRKLVDAPN